MTKIVDEPIIGTSKNLRGNVDVHNMQMDFQNSLPTCQMQINIVIEKKYKWLEWFIFCLFCGLASLKLYAIIIQRK